MKIVNLIALALLVSACGKDNPAAEPTPCASDAIVGTYQLASGSATLRFAGTCKAVSSDCNTTFSFPQGINATTSTQSTTLTVLSADGGSGCYTPGTVLTCQYNLAVSSSSTLFQLNCGSIWYSYNKL